MYSDNSRGVLMAYSTSSGNVIGHLARSPLHCSICHLSDVRESYSSHRLVSQRKGKRITCSLKFKILIGYALSALSVPCQLLHRHSHNTDTSSKIHISFHQNSHKINNIHTKLHQNSHHISQKFTPN